MISRRMLLSLLIVALGLGMLTFSPLSIQASSFEPAPAASNSEQTELCRTILTRALDRLGNTCTQLSRNNACYGNDQVKADLVEQTPFKFNSRGDRAPIQMI